MAERTAIAAIALVAILQVGIAAWWIPQKWHVCTRLYDNRLAQIICVGNHG